MSEKIENLKSAKDTKIYKDKRFHSNVEFFFGSLDKTPPQLPGT